ncbi:hypothetical protein FSP39_003796 [Pinctada imbricata]|uniref:Uncharacterized protein n=1 Tax=Pinctada imbricata TaxID=66713 RepID=A0AA88Y7F0_PINIB|nr:hypothetical protein FSP39_003796 [Pinctada imbricata]
MIKDLIVSKLNQAVSQYVENINPDNITYSLFEGKGELRDLKLKPAALLGKELPVEVKAGYVDYIKIQIPLSNLFLPGSEGMRLELDGLNVLLGPVTDRPYDKERDEELQHAIKTAKLQAFETSTVEIVSEEAKKNPTLFERMGKYILNNIQIKVSNIHIRYEDSVTNGDYSFAVGTILRSLHVVTTDDKWQEAELDSSAKVLHKLGKLTDFSVYWNHYVKDPDLVGKKQRIKTEEWRRLMRSSVSTYKIKEEAFQPILEPVSAEAKIIMNNQDDLQMPKLYIQFSLPEFESVFSRHQYMNLLKWIDSTTRMQVNQRYRKYQPNMPIRHNAKIWWQYAIKAVLEEYIRPYSWQNIVEHSQKARRYKDLFKRHLEHPDNTAFKDVLDHVERSLDITSIMAARGKAKAEFAAEAPERAKRKKKKEGSSGGWFSWIWGSEEEEEDITIDEKDLLSALSSEERKELYNGIGYDENAEKVSLPKEYVAYKIQFEMKKCSATLMNYSKPILQVALSDMLTSYENRPGGEGARVLSNTESFTIEGASVDYNLVSLLTSNGGIYTTDNQMFTLDYELRPLNVNADQSLKLNIRPVEIVYDEHALSQVLMFFQVPDEAGTMDVGSLAREQLEGVMKYSRDTLLYAIEQKSTFHISVHMRSPYIVIPQKGTLHSGGNVLVVDFGKLDVQSELQDKVDEVQNESITELESRLYDKFMVKVTDVKVLIADSGDDWHLKQTTENSKYHILPSTGFVVAFHKTVIPDNYQIPHHKFDARLQTLEINMTDEQLLILYSFIYNFPMPNTAAPVSSYMDRPLESSMARLVRSEAQLEPDIGSLRKLKNSILKRTVVSLEDVEEEEEELVLKDGKKKKTVRVVSPDVESYLSASEDSDDDKKKSEKFQKVKSVDDFLSRNVKMKMLIRVQLGELLVQMSLEQNKKTVDYLMFRLDRIEANMATLVYTGASAPSSCGMEFHAIVGGIRMADKLHTGASGAYLELLKTEAQNELISISYRQITPDCPDFKTKYDSIEHGVSTTFHNMSVIFDQTGICYLKKFLNNFQERLESLEVKEDLPLSPPPQAILRRTDSQSSSLASRAIDLSKRLSSVMDHVDMADRWQSWDQVTFDLLHGTPILTIESKDSPFFDMKVEQFKENNVNPRGRRKSRTELPLDYVIRMRVGNLQFAYISKFLFEIMRFFEPMKSPEITEAATVAMETVTKQVAEIHPTSLAIGVVIDMHIPTVIVPKHSKSPDLFFVKFGNLKVSNVIKTTELENGMDQKWNDFTATLTSMQVSRGKLMNEQFVVMHHVVEPLNFKASLSLALHPFNSDVIYDISGDLDLVKVNLKQTDIRLMMSILRMNLNEGAPTSPRDAVTPTLDNPVPDQGMSTIDATCVTIVPPEESNCYNAIVTMPFTCIYYNIPSLPYLDAVTPTLDDPVPEQGMSTVDATGVTIVPPEESNCYNAIVTMQGLVVCLYEEAENTKVLSDRALMPILSKFEIGRFEIRANTYASGEDKMDVNVSLHTMSIDDVRPDSSIATKRIFYCTRDTVKVAETEEELLPLISVIYKVKANDNQEADIRMEKVTLNVHVPYLLALYNFYVAALGSDTDDVRTLARLTSVTSTSSEGETEMDAPLRPPQTAIRVFGTIKEPEIVLFGDPDKSDSRILVFEADIEFDLQNDPFEQKIRSKVKDMKMYYSFYGSESKTNQWVIQPTTVDFDRCLNIVSNHCQYNISIKELDLYVSPSVLQLMVNVQDMVKTEESKVTQCTTLYSNHCQYNISIKELDLYVSPSVLQLMVNVQDMVKTEESKVTQCTTLYTCSNHCQYNISIKELDLYVSPSVLQLMVNVQDMVKTEESKVTQCTTLYSNHCQYNISIKELDLYVSPSVLQLMVNVQDMVKTEESKVTQCTTLYSYHCQYNISIKELDLYVSPSVLQLMVNVQDMVKTEESKVTQCTTLYSNHCQYNISIKELDLYVSPSVLQMMVNVQDMVKTEESKVTQCTTLYSYHCQYNISIKELDLYVSPSVLQLMVNVQDMVKTEESKPMEDSSFTDTSMEINLWTVTPTNSEKWLSKIDESGEAPNPLTPKNLPSETLNLSVEKINAYFRVRNQDHHVDLLHIYSSVEVDAHDWSKQFHMTGELQLKSSFFNEKLSVWESLIEPVSEKEGLYRPWEGVVKMIRGRSYPMLFNYIQDDFNMEECLRNDVQQMLHKSKRRSSSSESETDSSTEMTVLRSKETRKRSRIASDKSYESLKQGSIQGESDTEPDGLIQSITNKLGGIFSDDSSEDADVSDTDENDDTFDPSLDKPVFLTPKGPIQVSRDQGFDEVDAPMGDVIESEEEDYPQSLYLIVASQDRLLLNVTPQALSVLRDITEVLVNKFDYPLSTLLQVDIVIPSFICNETDGLITNILGGIGHIALSAGAFVFDDDDDYLSGGGMDKNRMKIQVDGFDLSSTILHKRACRRLLSLAPEKNSTQYWYVLDIDVWHGRKVLNILSPMKVCNNLTVDIDVYCKTEDLKQYKVDEVTMETGPYTKLASISPSEEYHVPLFLACHCDVFVCPTSLPYRVHQNGIWWKDILLTKEKSKTYSCLSNMDEKSFNVKVLCKEGQRLIPPQDVPRGVPYYTLDIRPPVRIHNYLPFDLQFSLEGSGSFSSLLHGDSTALHTIDLTEPSKLHISDYLGCDWTGLFDISQDQEEFKAVAMSPFDFSSEENHNKHLALSIHSSQSTALDLYVYSPYWIINKTDLPIQLRGSNSDAVFDCSPQQAAPLLFRFKKNRRKKAKVKVFSSKWSQSFSMDTVGNSGVVICHDKERKKKYRLMLQFQWSFLKLTRIVTITPFFLVVNKSSQNLWYMEEDESTDLWLELKMGQCAPYWPATDSEKMFVKYDDSTVVSEHFPVNIPHNTVLRMEQGSALCVEVIGGLENPRTITFSDYDIGEAPVRVENLCDDVFIVIHQKGQHQMTVLSQNESILYTWDDPTGARKLMWNVYGRSDKQDSEIDINKDSYNLTQLSVKYVQASGTYNYKDSVDGSTLDSSPEDDSDVGDTVDGSTSLKTKSVKMTIYWVSFLDGQQRVIIFTTDERVARATRMMNEGEQASLVSVLSLDSIMLSVISEYYKEVALVTITSSPAIWEIEVKAKWKLLEDVTLVTWLEDKWIHGVTQDSLEDRIEVDFSKMQMTKPYMGELRRKCPPGLFLQYRQSPHQTFVHTKVQKVQIDNQLYDAYYQTVLNSYPTPVSLLKRQGPKPFIEFGMIRRTVPENHVDTFRQLQLIVQEFNVQLDWGFIESIQDVFADLMPTEDSESERLKQDILISQRSLKEISSVMSAGSSHRIFFETMKISPMKIHVSFSLRGNPHLTRDVQPSLASDIKEFLRNSIGATFTEVKDIELKMALFEVKGCSMTYPKMSSQLLAHYRQQLFLQFYVVIFGLDVLGNPYGLFKDILQGIGEFFYDPILDTIQGEDGISDNMMRGFQSAMGHIVGKYLATIEIWKAGGTANSVARITGSLGNAFAYLSFDDDFQRRRRRRLQQQPPDLPHSLAMAGKGFLSGIRFGLSGIVLDPLQGATEEGVEGFFKGLGKGLLGLITQPIGGVLDMVSLAFDGVRRSAEFEGGVIFRMRLPRFINRYKGLEPYSAYKARGNHLLYSIKDGQFTESEIFIDFAPLSHEERADLLFITTKHLLYLEKSRFVSGYGLEWKVELSSILGVPKLLEGEKKLIITLKDKCGTVFSDNRVEITSVDADILKWVQGKIEKVLRYRIYV